MIHAMSDDQLDREIGGYLAWQAEDLAGAPSAAEVARRIATRPGSGARPFGFGARPFRLAPRLAWLLLAVGLLLAAGLAIVAGALGPRPGPLGQGYEAVFLRPVVIDGLNHAIVLAVNAKGESRELGRFPLADWQYLETIPFGPAIVRRASVSLDGLLAIPFQAGGYTFHWQVIDLADPDADPVRLSAPVQDFDRRRPNFAGEERPDPVWGPGGRLAIPWYVRGSEGNHWRVSFFDARTGLAATAEHDDLVEMLPYWAADGAAVALGSSSGDRRNLQMLAPDGSVGEVRSPIVTDGHDRSYRSDGAWLDTSSGGVTVIGPGVAPERELSIGAADLVDAAWSFDGTGVWLVGRSEASGDALARPLWIERWTDGFAVSSGDPALAGSEGLDGRLAGLAPDDSMIALHLVTTADGGESPVFGATPLFGLIAPESSSLVQVSGWFAGWLAVPG